MYRLHIVGFCLAWPAHSGYIHFRARCSIGLQTLKTPTVTKVVLPKREGCLKIETIQQ